MNKISPILWTSIVLIVLLPTAAGRLIIDLAGGVLILLILTPLILGGALWIGLKLIQSKITTCTNCGANLLNNTKICPICGLNNLSDEEELTNNIPASSATIDITPK